MELFSLNKMRIRFWTRIDATNQAGEAPLNCYVTINKVKSSDFSVDLMIPLQFWDSKQQIVREGHPLSPALNQKISMIKLRLMQIEMQLSLQGEVTSKMVKEYFFKEYKKTKVSLPSLPKKEQIEVFYLFDEIESYLFKVRIPLGISKNTLKNNTSFLNNLKSFLKETGREKLEVTQVDITIVKAFTSWFKTKNFSVKQVHVNRHITYLRDVLEWCVELQKIKFNPLLGVKVSCKYEDIPEGFEIDDIEKLKSIPKDLLTKQQEQVLDIVFFMIGTGIDHCDYLNRQDSWLYKEDGRYWLKYTRQKTITYNRPNGLKADALLLPDAVAVVQKYGGIKAMPNASINQMNLEIKNLVKMAKIKRFDILKFTTKLMRKTYANLQSNYQGLSDESVAYLLGHTTTKHIKKYRKYSKNRVIAELKRSL